MPRTRSVVIDGEPHDAADVRSALDMIAAWRARLPVAAGRAADRADSYPGVVAALAAIVSEAATSNGDAGDLWLASLRARLVS